MVRVNWLEGMFLVCCRIGAMRMAHLRVGRLGEHGPYCVGVASEGVNARFGTHIPHLHKQVHTIQSLTIVVHHDLYPCSGVSAASDEDVNGWVKGHAVHSTQVTVVVSNHLQCRGGRLLKVDTTIAYQTLTERTQ